MNNNGVTGSVAQPAYVQNKAPGSVPNGHYGQAQNSQSQQPPIQA